MPGVRLQSHDLEDLDCHLALERGRSCSRKWAPSGLAVSNTVGLQRWVGGIPGEIPCPVSCNGRLQRRWPCRPRVDPDPRRGRGLGSIRLSRSSRRRTPTDPAALRWRVLPPGVRVGPGPSRKTSDVLRPDRRLLTGPANLCDTKASWVRIHDAGYVGCPLLLESQCKGLPTHHGCRLKPNKPLERPGIDVSRSSAPVSAGPSAASR